MKGTVRAAILEPVHRPILGDRVHSPAWVPALDRLCSRVMIREYALRLALRDALMEETEP